MTISAIMPPTRSVTMNRDLDVATTAGMMSSTNPHIGSLRA